MRMIESAPPSPVGRWDLYGPIHKGLRRAHCDMLQQLARADFARDCTALLDELKRHLAMAAIHLQDEERFIHSALEARAPGAARALERDHAHHRTRFVEIEAAIAALINARYKDAAALGRDLYLLFTRFVAEDLAHMAEEETTVWPQLCALFTDAELAQIESAIVASLPPEWATRFIALMVPAISMPERIALLSGMKAGAPPEVYAAVFAEAVIPTLAADELAELKAQALAA